MQAGSVLNVPSNWLWRQTPLTDGTAIVFDIDGVLSNADGRQHYITAPKRQWKEFFGACGQDKVIEETSRLLELIAGDVAVILLTGRPLAVQEATVEWFDRNNLRWDLLIMRPSGDYNSSLTFKQQTVRRLKSMGFDLKLAFEDDQRNQDMFKGEGVPCMYVHSGYYDTRDADASLGARKEA